MILAIDLILLFFVAIALARKGDVTLHDFNKEATIPLRAILALFVIFTHVAIWSPFKLGTEAVSVFLFMSGYGMCRSYESKGAFYLRGFVRKHFVHLFLPFALCSVIWVLRMYIANRLHGKCNYNGTYILNNISVGNFGCLLPNSWFPIELFVLGLIFVFSFRMWKGVWHEVFVSLGCVLLYVLSRYVLGWPAVWWITVWSYAVGVFYAKYEFAIKRIILQLRWRCAVVLAAILILANLLDCPIEMVRSLTGCVVVLTLYVMPLPRWNWLLFMGGISYEIYLTHGMVYNVLTQCGVYKYLATGLTLLTTPLFAFALKWGVGKASFKK